MNMLTSKVEDRSRQSSDTAMRRRQTEHQVAELAIVLPALQFAGLLLRHNIGASINSVCLRPQNATRTGRAPNREEALPAVQMAQGRGVAAR